MTLQNSGIISINDIVTEFGGTSPDGLEEYYRDGPLVSDNNLNVPACSTADCEVNLEDYYGAVNILSVIIDASANNIVLSDYFSGTDWNSTTLKEITIDTGVTIGSTDSVVPSCRTGVLAGGLALGGTLKLIVNGYIYGAGGAANSGTGGPALQAEVLLEVVNNSRIHGGGGGGGIGGQGADSLWYFDGTSWRYSPTIDSWAYVISQQDFYIDYGLPIVQDQHFTPANLGLGGTPVQDITSLVLPFEPIDGYLYERGAVGNDTDGNIYYHSIRRRTNTTYAGGAGGSGGRGIGSNQSNLLGSAGTNPPHAGQGGTGGTGGSWGAIGATGSTGLLAADGYHIDAVGARVGVAGGLGGYYIIGNANVTWLATGSLLGRVG